MYWEEVGRGEKPPTVDWNGVMVSEVMQVLVRLQRER